MADVCQLFQGDLISEMIHNIVQDPADIRGQFKGGLVLIFDNLIEKQAEILPRKLGIAALGADVKGGFDQGIDLFGIGMQLRGFK